MQYDRAEAFVWLECVPAGQSEQLAREIAPIVIEYLPTVHHLQVSSDVAPSDGENVPAGQGRQNQSA